MNKKDLYKLFDCKKDIDLARLLCVSRQSVGQWPEELPDAVTERLIGRLLILGQRRELNLLASAHKKSLASRLN
jgi:hypothetical protein